MLCDLFGLKVPPPRLFFRSSVCVRRFRYEAAAPMRPFGCSITQRSQAHLSWRRETGALPVPWILVMSLWSRKRKQFCSTFLLTFRTILFPLYNNIMTQNFTLINIRVQIYVKLLSQFHKSPFTDICWPAGGAQHHLSANDWLQFAAVISLCAGRSSCAKTIALANGHW